MQVVFSPERENGDVVSYNEDGAPLSFKDDDIWRMEHLRTKLSENVNLYVGRLFQAKDRFYIESTKLAKDVLKIIVEGKHKGKPIRFGTVKSYYKLVKKMGAYCAYNDIPFHTMLTTPHHLVSFAKSATGASAQNLSGLLIRMHEELKLDLPYELIPFIRDLVSNFEKAQTLAIPPRILSIKTFQFEEILDLFLHNCRNISRFACRVGASKFYARCKERQEILAGANGALDLTFDEAVVDNNLEKIQLLFKSNQISGFSLFLTLVQYSAKCLIQIFSAARHSEALELRYGCLGRIFIRDVEIRTITGLPAKKKDVSTTVTWVTSNLGVKAVKAARILSRIIYKTYGSKTSVDSLLFISTTFSPLSSKAPGGPFPQVSKSLSPCNVDKYLLPVVFEEADYRDLKYLLPLGEADAHPKLIVGEPWNLTTHQFRRSFGIYGTASGLAGFPALKRQFHHFKMSTSIAYGEGGSARVEFGGEPDHIRLIYDDVSLSMDSCLYVQDVLFSTEKLYGPKGNYIEKNVKPALGDNIRLVYEETAYAVKNGLMAYSETILGGCTTTKACKEKAHGSVVVCTECADGVIKKSKLIPVIDAQEELVLSLPTDSVEFRTEKGQLEDLQKFLLAILENEKDK